jgi:hypothetical protein
MDDKQKPAEATGVVGPQAQPGAVVSPQSTPQSTPQAAQPQPLPTDNISPQPDASSLLINNVDETSSNEMSQQPNAPETQIKAGDDGISWNGPEFIAHDKSSRWYLFMCGGTLVICALIYLLLRDVVTVLVVIVSAALITYYGSRKPRYTQYVVDKQNFVISNKQFNYGDFRSFSVVNEGHFYNATLMPLKRFSPTSSLYFDQSIEQQVFDLLSEHLPFEEHRPDLLDRLLRRIGY